MHVRTFSYNPVLRLFRHVLTLILLAVSIFTGLVMLGGNSILTVRHNIWQSNQPVFFHNFWKLFNSQGISSSVSVVGKYVRLTKHNNTPNIFDVCLLKGQKADFQGQGSVKYFLRTSSINQASLILFKPNTSLPDVAKKNVRTAIFASVAFMPVMRMQFIGHIYISGILAGVPIFASIVEKSLAAIPQSQINKIEHDSLKHDGQSILTISSKIFSRAPVVLGIAVTLLTLALVAYLMWKSRAVTNRIKRDKAMFLAFVSHEIRTPLQTVLSSLEFLQRTQLPVHQACRVDAAASASETLLTLLDDILDYSRLESSRVTLSLQTVDLNTWARQTVDMVRWRAERKALALFLDISTLPPLLVLIDPVRVRQILLNLLVNAINFTATGDIMLRVSYQPSRHGNCGLLRLEVRDTGIGIAPDRISQVFEVYWQADRTLQSNSGGSGLGLAICRELVELMHGSISVKSTPGVETVFTVELPVSAIESVSTARAQTITLPVDRAAVRILIVDDHEAVRAALQDQCEALGCIGIAASTGKDALRYLADGRIDMVLVDHYLPDMDGYALARAIRQEETARKTSRVPLIAISAETGDMHREMCFDSGMDGVLGKPLRLETLRQAIATWCVNNDEPGEPPIAPGLGASRDLLVHKSEV